MVRGMALRYAISRLRWSMMSPFEILKSIKGVELAFFSIMLIASQWFYVSLANDSDAGFQLYASAWFMSIFTALTVIKFSRILQGLFRKS